jgi:crotonobetainyl-CoA:carnitine CoA-transferase CaiB-like acyl-CoA transferase
MNAESLTAEAQAGPLAEPGVLAGQHTDKILAELGYDSPAIASLKERGIVA